ncbi:MAG: glutamate-1-semialdehyde 2,1-aminomutase, partial [Sedimentisphaerales bacterium]|nr:glutamate-1-semialdehyde 2,1-aminomutase [Sedimentisphaerales bacterium]
CIPGGVNSPVRAFGGVDADPLFIARGAGSKIYDIDGNEYIDYVGSWGPLILGHAHPKVVAAVTAAAERGASFGAPTLGETQLAEKVVSAFDSIEKVRMVNSGTEAVMTAIRLARAYTGRDYIIKMIGCYHGHSDALLVAAGSGLAELSTPSSAGVPRAFAEKTIAAPYNDVAAVEAAFDKYKNQIAAVLVEPVAANMGLIPPKTDYLKSLRHICDDNGAVLIFDEVISGFRVALGGAQELFGIRADITCLGKIIGGGLPVGAVGGRAAIMDLLAPSGPVYQAGTLSGNPLAMAAAIATLDVLAQRDCYRQLEQAGRMLQEGFEEASRKTGIPVTVNRVGSILSCFFAEGPVRDFDDVQQTNIGRFKKYFSGMLNRGIYLAPSAFEAMFVSLAHSEKDLEKTIESVYNVFCELAG